MAYRTSNGVYGSFNQGYQANTQGPNPGVKLNSFDPRTNQMRGGTQNMAYPTQQIPIQQTPVQQYHPQQYYYQQPTQQYPTQQATYKAGPGSTNYAQPTKQLNPSNNTRPNIAMNNIKPTIDYENNNLMNEKVIKSRPFAYQEQQPIKMSNDPYQQHVSQDTFALAQNNMYVPTYLSKKPKEFPGGLPNLGNTCYMNAVLQCLFNLPDLMEYFQDGRHLHLQASGTSGKAHDVWLINSFTEAFMKRREGASASELLSYMENFKVDVERLSANFKGTTQNDAHEFLRLMLNELHNEIKRIRIGKAEAFEWHADSTIDENYKIWYTKIGNKDDSLIYDLFGGVLLSIIRCSFCHHVHGNFENFLDLSLSMRKNEVYYTGKDTIDIDDCIKEFFKDEFIDGYACQKCKKKGPTHRKFLIYKAPRILVIQLKRFEFRVSYGDTTNDKIETKVKTRLNNFSIPQAYCCNSTLYKYDISGIVNHYGNLSEGHYIADTLDSLKGCYINYDDSQAKLIDSLEMKEVQEKNGSRPPYLYFYYRTD